MQKEQVLYLGTCSFAEKHYQKALSEYPNFTKKFLHFPTTLFRYNGIFKFIKRLRGDRE